MNTEEIVAGFVSASKTVEHLNTLPGVKADIVSASPGGEDGMILPGISIDVSKVWEPCYDVFSRPKCITDEPITPAIIEAIVEAGKTVQIEELIIHRDGDSRLGAVDVLLLSIPAEALRRVSLQMYRTTDRTAQILARFHSLTHVDLANCREITNAGLAGLKASSGSIESLNLRSTRLNDEGLVLLSGMTKLKDLTISYTNIKCGSGLKYLADLPNLETLEWYANGNTGQTNVVTLAPLRGGGFRRLKTIRFGANTIHDAHVACLASCSALEKLIICTVGSTDITDEGLKPVGKNLANLKSLSLNGSFSLGDAGVAHLSNLKRLEYLDLGRTRISSKSLETTFKEIPALRVLDINGSSASRDRDALEALQRHNPRLSIIIDYMADAMDGALVFGKEGDGFDRGAYL